MRKKRITTMLLVLIMNLTVFMPAMAEEVKPLVLATATQLSGTFFSSQWGDNTTDMQVRALVNGYPTTVLQSQQAFGVNFTVVAHTREDWVEGQKVVTITLKDGLLWDDGTAIEAKDYAFSLLLLASPAMRSLGGQPSDFSYLSGFRDYAEGNTQAFAGLRLLDRLSFSMTIEAEALPFFYETSYLTVHPYPAAVLAPGTEVVDSQEGARLEPALEESLLRSTILDPVTGYLVRPVPGCGPYRLVGYDPAKGIADFRINPYFLGDHTGRRPSIPALRIIQASGEEAIRGLRSGTIDILHKVVDGQVITVTQKLRDVASAAYARRGYAFFAFDAGDGVTASQAVRQAIAYSIKTESIAKQYTKGFGWPVYGEYGFGHWAAAQAAGVEQLVGLPSQNGSTFASFDALPLNHYGFNLKKAEQLLQEDGWQYDSQGKPYKAGSGRVRYRKTDQGLEPLQLSWLQAEGSQLSQLAERLISGSLKRIGFRLEVTRVSQQAFFESYYADEAQGYNLYLLASNFAPAYDPYAMFMSGKGKAYSLGREDQVLMEAANQLRQTPAGDTALYVQRFLTYQQRFNELLPTLPVYSNIYFDFFSNRLRNYQPQLHTSAVEAILYSDY